MRNRYPCVPSLQPPASRLQDSYTEIVITVRMRDIDMLKILPLAITKSRTSLQPLIVKAVSTRTASRSPYIKVELEGTRFRSSFPAGASRVADGRVV